MHHLSKSQELSYLQDGIFVIISLDPSAMLESTDDDILRQKCANFKVRKYLAVVGLRPIVTSDQVHNEVEFHVMSATPAADIPVAGVTKNMYIPVFPAQNHPQREPLVPTGQPLPFTNCCYHSHDSTFLLTVSKVTGFLPRDLYTYLRLDELTRLDILAMEDGERAASNRAMTSEYAGNPGQPGQPSSPFEDTTLLRNLSMNSGSVSASSTQDSPYNTKFEYLPRVSSASEPRYMARGHFKPQRGWQALDWCATTPKTMDNDIIPPANGDKLGAHPFRIKVTVSLDLREVQQEDIPNSIDFLREICELHELFLEHFGSEDARAREIGLSETGRNMPWLCCLACSIRIRNPALFLANPCRKLKRKVSQLRFRSPINLWDIPKIISRKAGKLVGR